MKRQHSPKTSKFSAVLNAARSRKAEITTETEGPLTDEQSDLGKPLESERATSASEPLPVSKRGRPRGKRSNENYEQVTAYIKRDTHRAVKIALLQRQEPREFSQLVEDLLQEWLNR